VLSAERFYGHSRTRHRDAMRNPFSGGGPRKPRSVSGLEAVPAGAQMVPMEVKKQYEANPVHIYHPTPYNAITVLRNRKEPHDWLVCGWYLDTFRDHGHVTGLVYRVVASNEDREHVVAELKKLDKDAVVKFAP
jgi:hypothetical protein